MTSRKPAPVPAVTEAKRNATIPKRQVIQHTKLLRAELQVAQQAANNALAGVDHDLASAASERDMAIELVNQRFETIRAELDDERRDIIRTIEGIEAGLKAIEDKPALSVVTTVAAQ